jgi:hypothetical protein
VLSEPSAVLLWQLGLAWSSVVAVVDASTGHRIVLSGFVLFGPVCVFFTGRWLRTALAGAWAICLVVILGIPDGIWGTQLETFLIVLAVFVAAVSTLALIFTVRTCLSLTVTAFLATACGGHAAPLTRRPTESARPVSCRQQYQDWKHGPDYAWDRKLRAAVRSARAAENAGNPAALRSAMNKLMPAAVGAAAAGAIPRCADPARLYAEYVTQAYAAGHNARSAKSLSGLLKAAAPLVDLNHIESRLAAKAHRALAKG